jgi:predicted acetyltransferase
VIGAIDSPQGYVIFNQRRSNGKATLRIRDWAVLSAEAGRSLWAFLVDHRSMIDKIYWQGAAIDPFTLLLPEQFHQMESRMIWLLRIVNLRSALEKRGYPSGVEAELHLDVRDDLLPDNTGKFILAISQRQGYITPGGSGAMRLDIRGLAPLYTGLYTPDQLQQMGVLDAPEATLRVASQIFAGASPWLPDFF